MIHIDKLARHAGSREAYRIEYAEHIIRAAEKAVDPAAQSGLWIDEAVTWIRRWREYEATDVPVGLIGGRLPSVAMRSA